MPTVKVDFVANVGINMDYDKVTVCERWIAIWAAPSSDLLAPSHYTAPAPSSTSEIAGQCCDLWLEQNKLEVLKHRRHDGTNNHFIGGALRYQEDPRYSHIKDLERHPNARLSTFGKGSSPQTRPFAASLWL